MMAWLLSTFSLCPARIRVKIFRGEKSIFSFSGQEAAQTPHCMHILISSPESTFW